MFEKLYNSFILKYPKSILAFFLIITAIFGIFATKVSIDASADTLLLDDDKDLAFTREISKRYYTPNFLVVTFSPKKELLSEESLDTLKSITDEFKELNTTSSVLSIINVPLLQSPPKPVKDLLQKIPTLLDKSVDKKLAKEEFLTNPLYKSNLVSSDFKTTAILIYLKDDTKYLWYINKKKELKKEHKYQELKELNEEFKRYKDQQRELQHQNLIEIRNIISKYKNRAKMFLGGVNMIADDMINFIKSDLKIFGSILILLLIGSLLFIFKRVEFVIIPITVSVVSLVITTGFFGLFGWDITVISSNYVSLQLIITISIILHLIVRYKELSSNSPNLCQKELLAQTIYSKAKPSFFAIITTIAGFGSLVLSNIKPVINLGYMMSIGVATSLAVSFILFPAIMMFFPKTLHVKKKEGNSTIMQTIAQTVLRYKRTIIITSLLVVLLSSIGALKLKVENSFINYFKKSTEIYKGMEVIDKKLGGTTPLDVIVTFKEEKYSSNTTDTEDEFSDFDEEFEENANNKEYWFSAKKIDIIKKVHNYLKSIKEIGNIQSFGTILEITKKLNHNKELGPFELAILYKELPKKFRSIILDPYVNIEANQLRFATRVIDSNPNLRRNELIQKINKDLTQILKNDNVEFRLSNLMILYNNMLQSLFKSQIATLGAVVLILFLMFLALFKSLKVATIAIVSNIIPIGAIFAIMGYFDIPLDVMTITIASISIGIGVDDTIHYIHRFKDEFLKDKNYKETIKRAHNSIGYAMAYTSFTIILGFSILLASNFIPTIYFGFLTVLVMSFALLSALLLLPRLLISFKAFG